MRFPAFVTALALPLALVGAPALAASGSQRQVPRGFVGAVADGPLYDRALNVDGEFRRMAVSGVESVRLAIYWDDAQPYASDADVPAAQRNRFRAVDGVPTDFAGSDRLVEAAATHGLSVLPVVERAPAWARRRPRVEWSPPAGSASYARFMRALVARYGPGGSFWSEHPELTPLPVRDWQVWNEPNLRMFWDERPPSSGKYVEYHRRYIELLRAARDAVKSADPGARVVLAGFAEGSWVLLDNLYRFDSRVRRYFDVVAIHPFTKRPEQVRLIVSLARGVMNRHGDRRKPLLVTEMSWPSTGRPHNPGTGFEVSRAEQAARLARAYSLLALARTRLGLERVYWYSWLSIDRGSVVFNYSGLRSQTPAGSLVSKPAFFAFRRTALRLEGCPRGKLSVSRCR
jgi:polysaccharide biosynthesis protein PslG